MNKIGVLLINLGTPDRADFASVYRFLTQFLNDPRVIDLPALSRWILTNLIIVPFRCKKATHAYQQITTPQGLPLLVHTRALQSAVSTVLGNDYQVEIAMRYGNPSIKDTLKKLQHCSQLIVVPLFPHYSSAATGSAVAKLLEELTPQWNMPALTISRDFYNNPGFINAYAEVIKKNLADKKPDLILFSYHGLPERHITKSHCQVACDRVHACPAITTDNTFCYRAQCYATSTLLAAALNLEAHQYQVVFQSRLGRTPWIKPYTDIVLTELRQQGVKNIAIVSPSFVADCLETLEEINIRAREQWLSQGGSEFTFIPCVNDHPVWAEALANMIRDKSSH